MRQKNITKINSSIGIQQQFTNKYKDKIQYMNKHGIKQMYHLPKVSSSINNTSCNQRNLIQSSVVSRINKNYTQPNHKQHISKSSYKISNIDKNLITGNYPQHQISTIPTNQQHHTCAISFNNKQSIDNNRDVLSMQNSRIKKNNKQINIEEKSKMKFHHKKYLRYYNREDQNTSDSINILPIVPPSKYMYKVNEVQQKSKKQLQSLFHNYHLRKNPQLENFNIKLKQKQKLSYQNAYQGTFINQMMNKHENLIQYIASKNMNKNSNDKYSQKSKQKQYQNDIMGKIQRWDWRQSQQRNKQQNKISIQKQKIKQQEQNEEVFKFRKSQLIKIRSIQDMIASTKLNRLKERELEADKEWNRKSSCYNQLNNSQDGSRKANNRYNKDYRNIEKYDRINKQIQREFINSLGNSSKMKSSHGKGIKL